MGLELPSGSKTQEKALKQLPEFPVNPNSLQRNNSLEIPYRESFREHFPMKAKDFQLPPNGSFTFLIARVLIKQSPSAPSFSAKSDT